MKTIKFVVKVNRGTRAPEYVQRVDPTPLHMTANRKLALVMGKLTAEDAESSTSNQSQDRSRTWVRVRLPIRLRKLP
jgi:hypothetical protein